LGERGLSFLVALSNASFLLVLRQQRWLPQAAFALVGCGIFLGCFLGGDLSLVRSEDVSGLRRALVVQSGRSEPQEAGDVLRSIEMVLAGDEVDIALFPRDAVESGTPHGDRLLAGLRHMALRHAMEILAGESSASRRRAALDASEDASASGGGPGEDVGDGADAEEAAPQDEPAIPLGEPAIEDDEPAGGGEKRPGDGLLIIDREGRVAGGVRAASRLCSDPGSWRGEISAPAPIRMAGALVGAAVGPDFYSPAAARRLVRGGAEILLASDRDPRSWPRALARQHARMSELRAVENRRWLLRATHGGFSAFVTPQGRSIDSFSPDFSWPEIEEVELRDRLSPFTRGGWLFGPICMGLALLIAIAALFPRCWRPADEEPEGDDPRLHTERDPPPAGGS
ncbi:MAG: hypothetical protein JXA90_12440, partial [Planctomycetes bacterium]|nr:hypothetical protein [Planctomycetota bacterium]